MQTPAESMGVASGQSFVGRLSFMIMSFRLCRVLLSRSSTRWVRLTAVMLVWCTGL